MNSSTIRSVTNEQLAHELLHIEPALDNTDDLQRIRTSFFQAFYESLLADLSKNDTDM